MLSHILLIYWLVALQKKEKEKKKGHSHGRHKLKAKEVENDFFFAHGIFIP